MSEKPPLPGLPKLLCACATLRRADRVVLALYDAELLSKGYRITQFTLLQALHTTGEITQGGLAGILALDTTTLSRGLAPLIRSGFVAARPGADRRERVLRLSARGVAEHRRLMPHWQRAQKRLRRSIGDRDWATLQGLLDRLAGVNR